LSARLVQPNRDDEDDEEAIFAELEAEIENEGDSMAREQGLDTIKRELGVVFFGLRGLTHQNGRMERIKDMKANQHGQYVEITNEKEVMQVSA
jgi:hypothetical protein